MRTLGHPDPRPSPRTRPMTPPHARLTLRVRRVGHNGTGDWWTASVMDLKGGGAPVDPALYVAGGVVCYDLERQDWACVSRPAARADFLGIRILGISENL